MKKYVFLSRLIVASLFAPLAITAIAGESLAREIGLSAERRDALKTFLQAQENRGVEVRISEKTGIPEFLKRGEQPLARAGQHDDEGRARTALQYIARQGDMFRLRDVENELRLAKSFSDGTGRHHYVFQQHVAGVPIRGAQLRAHFDADGALYAVSSDTQPSLEDISVDATITPDDALRIARGQFLETALEQSDVRLELRMLDDGYRLVYVIETMVNTVNRWQSVIDAHNGEMLQHFMDHHEGSVPGYGIDLGGKGHSFQAWERTGRYHLVDVTVPVHEGNEDPLTRTNEYGDSYVLDMLNSEGESSQTVASNSAKSGWDPVAVSAMGNGQTAYRYFRDAHKRQGINGRNASLLFAIHYGENYSNAFWNGKWMVFGDGGKTFSNLAGCLDVVGHEMSHGVISTTAKLEYENQSGALNESFADLFGVLIDSNDWTVGEDCTDRAPGHIRDMRDPHQGMKWQPAHMSEFRYLANTREGDWGGVHVNSGIPNRAAYLLAEGLTKESLGSSIGRTITGQLYYRALSVYLSPQSEFIELRRALLLAAADLYPNDADVRVAIHTAFDTVGIAEGASPASDSSPVTADGQLTPSQRLLDFGDVATGESTSRSLAFTNHTDAAINVHDVVLNGANFSHTFTNTAVMPGDTLQGTVIFHGVENAGTQVASLEVHVNEQESPQIVDLVVTVKKETAHSRKQDASGGGVGGGSLLLLLTIGGIMRRRASP